MFSLISLIFLFEKFQLFAFSSFPPCHSIPTAYCCTPRVRSQCQELCAPIVSCAAPYALLLFNRDPSTAVEGIASSNENAPAASHRVHPTLIPPPASVDSGRFDEIPVSIVREEKGSIDGEAKARTRINGKNRPKKFEIIPESGAIPPPDSLTLIAEGGNFGEFSFTVDQMKPTEVLPESENISKDTSGDPNELIDLVDKLIGKAQTGNAMRQRSQQLVVQGGDDETENEKESEDEEEEEERAEETSPPPLARTTTTIGPWIIRTWSAHAPNNSSSNQIVPPAAVTPSTSPQLTTTSTMMLTSTSTFPVARCGVPPDYSSCVPTAKADADFLSCCRNSNLPAGCLSLCKYSTTHSEVKAIIDKGLCSVMTVPTFLKCASQGNDNSECCRHRQVHTKTGPQCTDFCRGQSSPLLGLQHLICTSAVDDLLHCHLSGLRA